MLALGAASLLEQMTAQSLLLLGTALTRQHPAPRLPHGRVPLILEAHRRSMATWLLAEERHISYSKIHHSHTHFEI